MAQKEWLLRCRPENEIHNIGFFDFFSLLFHFYLSKKLAGIIYCVITREEISKATDSRNCEVVRPE